MNEKARFYARFYNECPYCKRLFRNKKTTIRSNQIRKWLDGYFNPENS